MRSATNARRQRMPSLRDSCCVGRFYLGCKSQGRTRCNKIVAERRQELMRRIALRYPQHDCVVADQYQAATHAVAPRLSAALGSSSWDLHPRLSHAVATATKYMVTTATKYMVAAATKCMVTTATKYMVAAATKCMVTTATKCMVTTGAYHILLLSQLNGVAAATEYNTGG